MPPLRLVFAPFPTYVSGFLKRAATSGEPFRNTATAVFAKTSLPVCTSLPLPLPHQSPSHNRINVYLTSDLMKSPYNIYMYCRRRPRLMNVRKCVEIVNDVSCKHARPKYNCDENYFFISFLRSRKINRTCLLSV